MYSEDALIQVNSLAKKFCRDPKKSLRYGLQDIGRDLLGKPYDYLRDDEFWALKDVSMQISQGDSIGIIGNNGAGKSTLLKILAGILKPDYGTVIVNGKVVALLEIGAGFNSLLTGRENIYINGAFAGMTTKEIDLICDEIIDFAELAEFIDSPLRTYSTGMRSRLGFAMAVASKPDIVLLDETLAVGDISFRAKCEAKMRQLTSKGAVIVVVSQQMYNVMRVTQKCLWMERGRVLAFGETNNVCAKYIDSSFGSDNVSSRDVSLKNGFLMSDDVSEVEVGLVDSKENSILSVRQPQKIWVVFEFLVASACVDLFVIFRLAGRAGVFADNLLAPFEVDKTETAGVNRIKGRLMLDKVPVEKEAYVLRMSIYSKDKIIYKAPEAHFFVVEERDA